MRTSGALPAPNPEAYRPSPAIRYPPAPIALLLRARTVYTAALLRTDGAVTPAQYSPEETARRGQSIYEHSLRAQLEPQKQGKIVAIDVTTEAYEVADDVLTACEKLLVRVPNAEIWVVRIGHPAVYHLGWHGRSRGT